MNNYLMEQYATFLIDDGLTPKEARDRLEVLARWSFREDEFASLEQEGAFTSSI